MPKSVEPPIPLLEKPYVVTISSGDNPNLLMSTIAYPQAAGTAVVLDQVRPDGVPQPLAWWVLNPVSVKHNLYQILYYPHDGNLCLTAPSATANAPLTLQPVAAANMLQLWNVDRVKNGNGCYIRSYHSKLDIGFVDIPLKGTPLLLTADPAFHDGADPFVIAPVELIQDKGPFSNGRPQ